jgi:hypothetical protein
MEAETNLTTEFRKEIRYNRFNKDYDLFLDGAYVGSASTYSQGETALNALVYDALVHQQAA